jgi:hypothetical protein
MSCVIIKEKQIKLCADMRRRKKFFPTKKSPFSTPRKNKKMVGPFCKHIYLQ